MRGVRNSSLTGLWSYAMPARSVISSRRLERGAEREEPGVLPLLLGDAVGLVRVVELDRQLVEHAPVGPLRLGHHRDALGQVLMDTEGQRGGRGQAQIGVGVGERARDAADEIGDAIIVAGEVHVAAQRMVDFRAIGHAQARAGQRLEDRPGVPAIGPVVAAQPGKAVLVGRHGAGHAVGGADGAEIHGVGQGAIGILRLEAHAGAEPLDRPPSQGRVDVQGHELGFHAMVAADPVARVACLEAIGHVDAQPGSQAGRQRNRGVEGGDDRVLAEVVVARATADRRSESRAAAGVLHLRLGRHQRRDRCDLDLVDPTQCGRVEEHVADIVGTGRRTGKGVALRRRRLLLEGVAGGMGLPTPGQRQPARHRRPAAR